MAFQCYECHQKGSCKYHETVGFYPVGEHEAWPNVKVWLPAYGVSVGPCEDCKQERPCVNC